MSRAVSIVLVVLSLLVVTAAAVVYWPKADMRAKPVTAADTPATAIAPPSVVVSPPVSHEPVPAAPAAPLPDPRPAVPQFEPSPAARRANAALPALVAEMRDAILAAVRSGKVEELLIPIQWNELKPDFGDMRVDDPIAHFRRLSADGKGDEILAVLGRLLLSEPAVTRQGRDIENNRMFVWPGFTEAPLSKLDADGRRALVALVGEQAAESMIKAGRYRGWRLSIGADGVWHSFRKIE